MAMISDRLKEDIFEILDDIKETLMDRYGMNEDESIEIISEYVKNYEEE